MQGKQRRKQKNRERKRKAFHGSLPQFSFFDL